MSWRSIVDHYTTQSIIVVFCGTVVLLSLSATVLVRRAVPDLAGRNYERKIGTLRDLFGLLYFLVLAFGVNEIAGTSNEAKDSVSKEASSLSQIVRRSAAFPREFRVPLKGAVGTYIHAVVDDEFQTMRRGERSPLVAAAIANLFGVFHGYEPQAGRETVLYELIGDDLGELDAFRRERLGKAAQTAIPGLLGVFNLLGAFVFLGLAFPASIESRRAQMGAVGTMAALVSFAFLLTVLLDYPFSGDIAVSADPYRGAVLAQFFPGR